MASKPVSAEVDSFTPDNVTKAIEMVDWRRVCGCLYMPASKRVEIEREAPNDRMGALVNWWMTTDPTPSWRRLISRLDFYCQTREAADSIRRNAEPVQDPTLTLPNVITAVETVKSWKVLGGYLQVPDSKMKNREEMLKYFITTIPGASWETLAGHLYYMQQDKALEKMSGYLHRQADPTLTIENLCCAIRGVTEWKTLATYLDVPVPKQRAKMAILEDFLQNHPSPTWKPVLDFLFRAYIDGDWGKYDDLLQEAKEKYVKVELEYADLEFLGHIGSGASGQVWKGLWKSNGCKTIAIKKLMDPDLPEREIEILRSLNHPSVIHYYGAVTEGQIVSYFIVTEFAENGSIYDYIHVDHKQPSLSQTLLWATQVVEGMVYLHQQDIIHRDLKSSNVVLTSTLRAKICDLGSARSLDHTTRHTTAVGTYAWMAPEILKRAPASKACDVYSFGVLLYELVTQQLPFADVLPILIPSKVEDGKRPSIPKKCNSKMADLMKRCWREKAKSRPTFQDLLVILSAKKPTAAIKKADLSQ